MGSGTGSRGTNGLDQEGFRQRMFEGAFGAAGGGFGKGSRKADGADTKIIDATFTEVDVPEIEDKREDSA